MREITAGLSANQRSLSQCVHFCFLSILKSADDLPCLKPHSPAIISVEMPELCHEVILCSLCRCRFKPVPRDGKVASRQFCEDSDRKWQEILNHRNRGCYQIRNSSERVCSSGGLFFLVVLMYATAKSEQVISMGPMEILYTDLNGDNHVT